MPPVPETLTALLLGRVGDMIVATAFLRAFKKKYPETEIRLVIRQSGLGAARLMPFANEPLLLGSAAAIGQNARLAWSLFSRSSRWLVDLNPSFSRTSAILAAWARAEEKIGFSKGRSDWVFTRQIPAAGDEEPMLDRYARLSVFWDLPYEAKTELLIPAADEKAAKDLLGYWPQTAAKRKILFHAGNFKKFENRWPEDKFVALADRVQAETDAALFFLAGPGEEEPVSAIVSRLKRPAPILSGLSLGVLGGVIKRMDLCVLNITGTTHLAAALDIPTFGFYSGYTDKVWRPPGSIHSGVVSRSWESCRDIAVDEAYAALPPILGR